MSRRSDGIDGRDGGGGGGGGDGHVVQRSLGSIVGWGVDGGKHVLLYVVREVRMIMVHSRIGALLCAQGHCQFGSSCLGFMILFLELRCM